MSIIIKDIDMPKGEFLLEVITHYEGGEKKDIKFVHKEDIIEIPTPHGRLIDANELQELYADSDDLDLSNYDVKVMIVRQNIKDMPTILVEEE